MADVLPADDAEVSGEPTGQAQGIPPDVNIEEEYRYWSKHIDRERADKVHKNIRARGAGGRFERPYHIKNGWGKRKVTVNAKMLQEALDRNPTLKQLNKLLKTPYKQRLAVAARCIEEKELPPVLKEMEELQIQVESVTDMLCSLDCQMRALIRKADWIRAKARCVTVDNDAQLRKEIQKKISEITLAVRAEQVASDQMILRKQQGFWGYLRKKYGYIPTPAPKK